MVTVLLLVVLLLVLGGYTSSWASGELNPVGALGCLILLVIVLLSMSIIVPLTHTAPIPVVVRP